MTEAYFHSKTLALIQQVSWFLAIAYFSTAVIMAVVGYSYAEQFARWGVVLLMGLSVLTVIVIAEQFRSARLYRLWLLSYTLVIILGSTVIFGYFL